LGIPCDLLLRGFHLNILTSGFWHSLYMTEQTQSLIFNIVNNITLQAFEDGPDRGFRNVGQYKPDAGDTPKSGNS
jgi:hypothetical protein